MLLKRPSPKQKAGPLCEMEVNVTCDNCDLAHGALDNIRELLDDGSIPRGTFVDDQVRNLVALYNWRGEEIERLRADIGRAITLMDGNHTDRAKRVLIEAVRPAAGSPRRDEKRDEVKP